MLYLVKEILMATGYITIKVIYDENQDLEQLAAEIEYNLLNCDHNVTVLEASIVNPVL
jgi:hypothetical protein